METTQLRHQGPPTAGRFKVTVVAGRDKGAEARSAEGRCTVGTAEGNTLRLADTTVSRYHAELEATDEGVLVRDLGSTNGVVLGAARLREALLTESVDIDLGRTRLRVTVDGETRGAGAPGARVVRPAARRLRADAGDLHHSGARRAHRRAGAGDWRVGDGQGTRGEGRSRQLASGRQAVCSGRTVRP